MKELNLRFSFYVSVIIHLFIIVIFINYKSLHKNNIYIPIKKGQNTEISFSFLHNSFTGKHSVETERSDDEEHIVAAEDRPSEATV